MFVAATLIPLINFGFKFYYSSFLIDSNSVLSDCAIIQSFIWFHSVIQVFFLLRTILTSRGHGAIFTCDCNNLLKTCFCCCSMRKLRYVPKLYFARAFKKSNNYDAHTVILTPFQLLSCWGIQKQVGVFYRVKTFLYSSSW